MSESAEPPRIGRYRPVRRLGSGAFATVWLAHDPELDVDVAVKVLADNWAADDGIRERFVAEARYLRRIRDPRVVHVYDIGTLADGRPYFVMENTGGGSLEDLRRSGVAPAEALRLCAQAARGLQVLHDHGLVHRDVTPANLLLTVRPDGSRAVVVADLGVARSVADSSVGALVMGTPSYMAPEQAGAGPVDHRADLYALCAVGYALLTGAPPYVVGDTAELAGRAADARPAPLAARFGVPAALDGLLVSGLATEPHRRPPSAAVLAEALDQLATTLPPGPAATLPMVDAPTAVVPAVAPAAAALPTRVVPVTPPAADTARPAAPVAAEPTGRSAVFYVAMTVLAVVAFAVFLAVVVGLSL